MLDPLNSGAFSTASDDSPADKSHPQVVVPYMLYSFPPSFPFLIPLQQVRMNFYLL